MGAVRLMRYTNLASTIHILRNNCLTLLSPKTWNDQNDSAYIAEYKRRKKAKSVLALCFTETIETYHHWSTFAPGCDGVCIEFDRHALIDAVQNDPDVKAEYVRYSTIDDVEHDPPGDDELPFLKRLPYEPEKEFRIIFMSTKVNTEAKRLPILLTAIKHITLSPWMPEALEASVTATLKSIPECDAIPMHRSTLINNEDWRKAVEPDLLSTV